VDFIPGADDFVKAMTITGPEAQAKACGHLLVALPEAKWEKRRK
jgi:hypothetical protein